MIGNCQWSRLLFSSLKKIFSVFAMTKLCMELYLQPETTKKAIMKENSQPAILLLLDSSHNTLSSDDITKKYI